MWVPDAWLVVGKTRKREPPPVSVENTARLNIGRGQAQGSFVEATSALEIGSGQGRVGRS